MTSASAAMAVVLVLAGCGGSGGTDSAATGSDGPGGGGGGGGGVSASDRPLSPGATPTSTVRAPIAGGDGFHLELTYTYTVSLEVIAGAAGTTSGVDTFEGDLLPVENDADGSATRYEGTFQATAIGSSDEDVLGTPCEADWAGEQELDVVGEVVGDEIDLTFRSASAPTYEVRSGDGDLCPGVIDQMDVEGGPMLPFNDAVIAAGIPLSLLLPEEPGEQTIPIEGTIARAEVDSEWHAVWTEPDG